MSGQWLNAPAQPGSGFHVLEADVTEVLAVDLGSESTSGAAILPLHAEERPDNQTPRILKDLHRAREEHAKQVRALQRAPYEVAVSMLAAAGPSRGETLAHALRVGSLAALLANANGSAPAWCNLLEQAAVLHDIGKIATPEALLSKLEPLTPAEWKIIAEHTSCGATMLSGRFNPLMDLAAEVALNHHEHWDGKGYPAAKTGEEIPLSARLVAAADFIDALMTPRPYREATTEDQAFSLLAFEAGHRFDPRVVEHALKLRPRIVEARKTVDRLLAEGGYPIPEGTWRLL